MNTSKFDKCNAFTKKKTKGEIIRTLELLDF